jgi:hypothetical protein
MNLFSAMNMENDLSEEKAKLIPEIIPFVDLVLEVSLIC